MELISPRIVGRRQSDHRARRGELVAEDVGIINAEPEPSSRISLVTLAQHDGGTVTRNRGHDRGVLPIDLESEHPDVIVDAGLKNLIDTGQMTVIAPGIPT
jgi:hypothetical protein